MTAAPKGFRNPLVEERVHHNRDQFIASICHEDVIALAGSHHNGDACQFFKPPTRGSYNICYFVQFHSSNEDGDKWVVRVPLAPCLAFGGRSKLESEVATMQLIAEKTSIPIPKIHAYNLGDDIGPLSSYLILQYIEGRKLTHTELKTLLEEQRTNLYTSLADVYIQLRRLEFPLIGCLTQGSNAFEVSKRTVTIDLNMQELEGLEPHIIQSRYYSSSRTLTSANDYITMLLEIADNAFARDRNPVPQDECEDRLYHMHIFRQYTKDWANQGLNHGPFVLVHGDLELFNLLLNDDMTIASVLDWEWSRVVPCQLFKPPLWLSTIPLDLLCYNHRYTDFLKVFDEFLAIMRVLEQKKFRNQLLTYEWDTGKLKSGFMVANALENWTAIDWFANRWINSRVYGGKEDLEWRIKEFMQADSSRQRFVERRALRAGASKEESCDNLPDHDVVIPSPDCRKNFFCLQDSLTGLWKMPFSFYFGALPLATGSFLLVAGVSILFRRRRILQSLFSFPPTE